MGHLDLALQEDFGKLDKAILVEVVESVETAGLVHRTTAAPTTTTVEATATTATTAPAPRPSEELCSHFLSIVSEQRYKAGRAHKEGTAFDVGRECHVDLDRVSHRHTLVSSHRGTNLHGWEARPRRAHGSGAMSPRWSPIAGHQAPHW